MKARQEVLAGQRFGRRVVLRMSSPCSRGRTRARVRCDCGREGVTLVSHLLSGKSGQCSSCGARAAARARHDEVSKLKARVAELEAENELLRSVTAPN